MMHLQNYLKRLDETTPGVSGSVIKTVDEIMKQHIKKFSYKDHQNGLLLGQVQSGKTSQIFGVMAAAADAGFTLFIMLTTDNVYLQKQTIERALNLLETFVVCDESDEMRFFTNGMRKPILIVLKKNTRILQGWRNNLSSSGFCEGRPLFIVDDEADAASLNTLVNKEDQSKINSHLESIKNLSSSSIYMQVTATPQAVILQSTESGWRPSFVCSFEPGIGYLGGDFFYSDPISFVIKITDDELVNLRNEDEYITQGLRQAIFTFLLTAAHLIKKDKSETCNFLVHPSHRIADHKVIAEKIGGFLNLILAGFDEPAMIEEFDGLWRDLQSTKPDLIDFNQALNFIRETVEDGSIKIVVMNSIGSEDTDCSTGMNIIIGGNSLGRGVTFKRLQTVYYSRQTQTPQADTYWQHCRMFGYDRDPLLMRVFLPSNLHRLFTELNDANNILINQILRSGLQGINVLYPNNIKPTRSNVIDNEALDLIVGGVNYFPAIPEQKIPQEMDLLLNDFVEKGSSEIDLKLASDIIGLCPNSVEGDWFAKRFVDCVNTLNTNNEETAVLIIRKNRDIGKGTGTMLSQDDREIAAAIHDKLVVTLYRNNGNVEKGWSGQPFWMANVKLPVGMNFYKSK